MNLEDTFVRQLEINDATNLIIHQTTVGDVGCVVWDAALVLAKFLINAHQTGLLNLKDARMVELGAGTGIVGLTAATLGADVIITDLEELVPLIKKNIDCNRHVITGKAEARSFCWGKRNNSLPNPQYILVSDCLYYCESLKPLLKTLCDLSDKKTTVLFCYERRDSEDKLNLEKEFFEMIREFFTVETIPEERLNPDYSCSDILVMTFRRH